MSPSIPELIEAVRHERVLYDTNHPKYMKGAYKEEIWSDIARALQFEDGAAAKEAWLRLRNCHRDALRRQKKLKCISGSRALVTKQWKYQQEMEFLIPFMTNRETSSSFTWTDGSHLTVEADIISDEEISTLPTTASRENLTYGDIHHGFDAAVIADDSESIVGPSAYSKDMKKKRLSDIGQNKTDLTVLLKESILNYDERDKNRALGMKKMEEKLKPQEIDPLYNFFMAMYGTTAKMPPASQHMIKREIFRIVSDAEETMLGMSPYLQGHSSPSSGPTTRICTPTDPSTSDIPQSSQQDSPNDFSSNYYSY